MQPLVHEDIGDEAHECRGDDGMGWRGGASRRHYGVATQSNQGRSRPDVLPAVKEEHVLRDIGPRYVEKDMATSRSEQVKFNRSKTWH